MIFGVETVIFREIGLQDFNGLSLEDYVSLDLISILFKFKVLGSHLSSNSSVFLPLNPSFLSFNLILHSLLNGSISGLNHVLMDDLCILESVLDNIVRSSDCCKIFLKEVYNLVHKPWHNFLLHVSYSWCNKYSTIGKLLDGLLSDSSKVVLSEVSCSDLLMGTLLLLLPLFVLNISSLNFLSVSLLCGLVSLSYDEFSVHNFIILFLLGFYNVELSLFKNLHTGLFKSLVDQNIQHRLNFRIEIKQFFIALNNLSGFAVLLCWHPWLEEWYRRSIEVEFSGDTNFIFRWLISQDLFVR
jgi:hypothetical protein